MKKLIVRFFVLVIVFVFATSIFATKKDAGKTPAPKATVQKVMKDANAVVGGTEYLYTDGTKKIVLSGGIAPVTITVVTATMTASPTVNPTASPTAVITVCVDKMDETMTRIKEIQIKTKKETIPEIIFGKWNKETVNGFCELGLRGSNPSSFEYNIDGFKMTQTDQLGMEWYFSTRLTTKISIEISGPLSTTTQKLSYLGSGFGQIEKHTYNMLLTYAPVIDSGWIPFFSVGAKFTEIKNSFKMGAQNNLITVVDAITPIIEMGVRLPLGDYVMLSLLARKSFGGQTSTHVDGYGNIVEPVIDNDFKILGGVSILLF
jgi:hypothetical protein